MDRFRGNEELKLRQKRLSISGQVAQTTSSSKVNGAQESLAPRTGSGFGFGSTQRYQNQRRAPPPPPRNEAKGSIISSNRSRNRSDNNSIFQRNSVATAATIRATCHQMAETLNIFGEKCRRNLFGLCLCKKYLHLSL